MADTDSIDGMIEACATYGPLIRALMFTNQNTTTAATTNSGSVTGSFMGRMIIPSMTSPVISVIFTQVDLVTEDSTLIVAGYRIEMGSLAISGNTFTSGTAMPTRTIAGTSVQTASVIPILEVTTALTATTPTITITYTDQDGNTGQTCTVTLPTSPALTTCFNLAPHLATGDTGMRAVTNMSTSAGSAGTLKVYGFIPIAYGVPLSPAAIGPQPLSNTLPFFPFKASDEFAIYRFGSTSTTTVFANLYGVPETGF